MNRPRKYSKNYTGISISEGYGQINISKVCMEVLEHPQTITFVQTDLDSDWLYLLPDCEHPPEHSVTGRVKYRDWEKQASAYIASQEVVISLFVSYGLTRKEPFVYSPFYIVRKDSYDGQPCVRVCMNNFEKYMNKDEHVSE